MVNKIWWQTTLGALLFASACGTEAGNEPVVNAPTTDDGVQKVADGKADAWNWRNNPDGFRTEFDYMLDNLPAEGASARIGWAASYWPYYEDGINARWQGNHILSPAEKYDKAFNNWSEPDGFMDLQKWNSWTCEFDQAYYDAIGPAASWTNRNKGTYLAHNGIDDDDDGVADADECAQDRSEYDGLESWWGICHAWAPAAIMEDEPLRAVERNGVRFEVSDIKALLIQQYDSTGAYLVGGRCNDREIERDDTGRVTSTECRDLNAGSWHVIVTNLLGKHSRPFVIERTAGYQVWNQPLVGYEITEQREISLAEAHELLRVETEAVNDEGGTGEFVFDVEEGSLLASAILDFVNNASFDELDIDARLYYTAARNIVDERPFSTLAELDAVPYVSSWAFNSLIEYVQDNGLVPSADYKYNADATRFVEVRMSTDWVTESHPSTNPMTPVNDNYMRHDHYHYIVELNDAGEVIGGEWLGDSNLNHPDFVWLPVAPRGGNPHIDIDEVRRMIAETRTDDDGDDDDDDNSGAHSYASGDVVAIPDNDPAGATSVIEVADSGSVRSVLLDLEIDHTYRGDLVIQLAHGGVVMTVYDGADAETPWADDVVLDGVNVDGFLGADLAGEWELRIVDTYGADVGSLLSWGIHVETN